MIQDHDRVEIQTQDGGFWLDFGVVHLDDDGAIGLIGPLSGRPYRVMGQTPDTVTFAGDSGVIHTSNWRPPAKPEPPYNASAEFLKNLFENQG